MKDKVKGTAVNGIAVNGDGKGDGVNEGGKNSTASEGGKNTETLILEAAMKEFAKKGFAGARTADIAAEAGVTHAMLHYYFRSKQQLFERIAADKMETLIEMVFSVFVSSTKPLPERIADGVAAHFDFLMANRYLPLYVVNAVNSSGEYLERMRMQFEKVAAPKLMALQVELNQAAERGEICRVSALSLLADIVSLNIFPLLASNVFEILTGVDGELFIANRKKENIKIIMKRLRP